MIYNMKLNNFGKEFASEGVEAAYIPQPLEATYRGHLFVIEATITLIEATYLPIEATYLFKLL